MKLMIIFSCLIGSILPNIALSAVQNAQIHQRIFPTLDVKRISDMYFPDAYPGSSAYTIDPTQAETAQNASFLVTGEAGKHVSILLPTHKVTLENAPKGAKIYVNDFKSNTGNSAKLDNNGELNLYVGATREDIPTRTPSGDYIGTFTVTVMY